MAVLSPSSGPKRGIPINQGRSFCVSFDVQVSARAWVHNTSQCRIGVELGENIRALGVSSLTVDSASNSAIVSFTTRRYAEDNRGTIGLEPPSQTKPQILFPDAHIEYLLEEGGGFWLQIIVALAFYAIAGALIGVDFSKLNPFTWCGFASCAARAIALAGIQAWSLAFEQALVRKCFDIQARGATFLDPKYLNFSPAAENHKNTPRTDTLTTHPASCYT